MIPLAPREEVREEEERGEEERGEEDSADSEGEEGGGQCGQRRRAGWAGPAIKCIFPLFISLGGSGDKENIMTGYAGLGQDHGHVKNPPPLPEPLPWPFGPYAAGY